MYRVLNVGGGAGRYVSDAFKDYKQVLLDIDESVCPDICMDARDLLSTEGDQYEGLYCSHVLEHFYLHDVPSVLSGFRHVLKEHGFAQIAVPDIEALIKAVADSGKDIMSTWYRCNTGDRITFHDVLFGWSKEMSSGNLYYAHRCGFTLRSLTTLLRDAGFSPVYVAKDGYNLHAYAFMKRPNSALKRRLGI